MISTINLPWSRVLVCLALLVAVGCQSTAGLQAAAVSLEIRPAFDEPANGLTPMTDELSGKTVYLSDEVLLSNGDIRSTKVGRTDTVGPAIILQLTDEASGRFGDATERMLDKKLAIVLDGKVLAAPVVRSRITRSVQITGDFTQEEAKRIAEGLKAGAR